MTETSEQLSEKDATISSERSNSPQRRPSLLKRLTTKIKTIRDSSEERKSYNWFTGRSNNSSLSKSPERKPVTLEVIEAQSEQEDALREQQLTASFTACSHLNEHAFMYETGESKE